MPEWGTTASSGRGRFDRVLRRVGLLLPAALILVNVLVVGQHVRATGGLRALAYRSDFMPTLAAATMLRSGRAADLFDMDSQRNAEAMLLEGQVEPGAVELLPYNHLPIEALAVAWLQRIGLSDGGIFAVWSTLNVAALLVALWMLRRVSPVPGAAGWMLVLAACSYVPVVRSLVLGQNTALVLLGLCAVHAARRNGRDWLAGAALVLVALKPQLVPVMVVLLFVQRSWRTLAGFGALSGALCLAVMPLLGAAWPVRYARLLIEIAAWGDARAIDPLIMPSWRGLAANLIGGPLPALVVPAFLALSLLSIGVLVQACLRARPAGLTPAARDLQWALAATAALLTAVHLNPHDLALLLLPAWIVASHALSGPAGRFGATLWVCLLWLGYAAGILPAYPFVLLNVAVMATAFTLLAREVAAPGPLREPVAGPP